MKKRIPYFYAYRRDGTWMGNATLAAIKKAGLTYDPVAIGYETADVAPDGWAFKSPASRETGQ
jgi:hypothetical protein